MPHEKAGVSIIVDASKSRAAAVSVAFNAVSTLFKLVGAILTHSVSLFSEAAHSAADVVASLIAFFSVKAASAPADDEHPFGHGKIESLAGFAESIFLLLTMGFIANEAINRLLMGGEVHHLETGVAIMAASAVGSLLVGLYVQKEGNRSRSLALQSNGQHLMVDFITSAGVLVALLIVRYTPWKHADPVLALVFAAWIGFNSVKLCMQAYEQLIDRRLADEEITQLQNLFDGATEIVSYHRLRTRLSGQTRHIDVHIVVPSTWSVVEAHRVADDLENLIRENLHPAEVVIHVDPYDDSGEDSRRQT